MKEPTQLSKCAECIVPAVVPSVLSHLRLVGSCIGDAEALYPEPLLVTQRNLTKGFMHPWMTRTSDDDD